VSIGRHLATTLAITIGLLALGPVAASSAATQGVYEGCAPGASYASLEVCSERLERIRAAGFDVVLNYSSWYASAENLAGYAAAADRLGLKLIWPLNGSYWRDSQDNLTARYQLLAPSCRCDDDAGFTAYAAEFARAQPATWGWYVGDEVPAAERDAVAVLSSRMRELDPLHPQLFISQESALTRGQNLQPFLRMTEYAGADVYPVGTGQGLDAVATVADSVRALVEPTGSRTAMVLQAYSLAAYPQLGRPYAPWPTAEEMRAMRDHALSAGRPDLLLWYSVHDVLDKAPDPEGQFARLQWAATASPATDLEEPRVAGRTVSVPFGSDAAGSAECRLDDRGWERCGSPFQAADLHVGQHRLAVRAHDLLGQTGRPTDVSFTVAPVVISRFRAPGTILTRKLRLRRRRAITVRCRNLQICGAAKRRLSGPKLRFSLNRPDRITITFSRRRRQVTLPIDGTAGVNRVPIPPRVERHLVAGRWRLEASAEGAERPSRRLRVRRARSRRSSRPR
jgi:hypothetical protein